jgi:hypothetical protein
VISVAELGALGPKSTERWRHMLAERDHSMWRELRRRVFGDDREHTRVAAFPAAHRPQSALPGGGTGWSAQRTFRAAVADNLADVPVRTMTPYEHPNGVHFRCDQRNMEAFRREYEFYYDAGNGGSEDDAVNGASIAVAPGRGHAERDARACRVATRASSIKMTTVAYRFRPADYPLLRFQVSVAKNVRGADVSRSGRGKNDAAFKMWLILRDTRPSSSGRTVLFGYSWSAEDARGALPAAGALVEARSSRRNIVVSTLPEAWLVLIGGPSGSWTSVERDLATDIARAYPQIPLGALQVVGITLQSDSDETRGATEVYLASIDIETRRSFNPVAAVKASLR